jgi:hypothetical protein
MHYRGITIKLILVLIFMNAVLNEATIQGQTSSENIIIITLDGFRWKEVFSGADKNLLNVSKNKRKKRHVNLEFWDDNPSKRRELLMPFLWSEVAEHGVLYGNRNYGCKVNVANRYWFSYPGYNEILTGNPSKYINSNSVGPNPNIIILETIHNIPAYKNKVAVFSSWKRFNDIVNEKRSGIYVNSGFNAIPVQHTTSVQLNIEAVYGLLPKVIGDVRYDGLTFMQAFEYLKNQRPKVLMIALGETDEFGHKGEYLQYLQSANRTDKLMGMLWDWVQNDSVYRNTTTLLITTDHGRGNGRGWRKHGQFIFHSNETWIAIMGPNIKNHGEVKQRSKYFNAQIAPTIASLLDIQYSQNNPQFACISSCMESNLQLADLAAILNEMPTRRKFFRKNNNK